MGLHNRRKVADTGTGEQGRGKARVVVHGKKGLKVDGFLTPSVHVSKLPGSLGLSLAREGEQPVAEQAPGGLRRLVFLEICRTSHQLMPVGQNATRDQRGIVE